MKEQAEILNNLSTEELWRLLNGEPIHSVITDILSKRMQDNDTIKVGDCYIGKREHETLVLKVKEIKGSLIYCESVYIFDIDMVYGDYDRYTFDSFVNMSKVNLTLFDSLCTLRDNFILDYKEMKERHRMLVNEIIRLYHD